MTTQRAKPIAALTVLDPWATLIALSAKHYETRSWATAYRGPLVIHAGKSRDWLYMADLPELPAFRKHIANPYRLKSLGCALCVVDLVDCLHTERARNLIDLDELQFGDYSNGRYAWKLENVRPFAEPVPARGAQGLWRWTGPLPEGVAL